MRFVVKNTTKCTLWDLLCPYTCRGCGALGELVCGCCKNDLILSRAVICPLCKHERIIPEERALTAVDFHCQDCDSELEAIFVAGWKEGLLEELIKEYKYQSVRAISEILAEILDSKLPRDLPAEAVVVPLPTIGMHIRQRGFDHTLLLAKKLARRRGWQCQQLLARAKDTVQVGTKAATRVEQANAAYAATKKIDTGTSYLLLDDIWTTGASMLAAASVMRGAGAKNLMPAVIATGKPNEAAGK